MSTFKKTLYDILYYLKAGSAFNFFAGKKHAVILAYHRVCPIDNTNYLLKDMIVEPAEFETQMQYIQKKFRVVALEDIVKTIDKCDFIERAVAITFDDAYHDNYEYAFPILKKFDMPATIFVPTGFIGNKRPFYWDEVSEIIGATNLSSLYFEIEGERYDLQLKDIPSRQKAFDSICSALKNKSGSDIEKFLWALRASAEVDAHVKVKTLSWDLVREMKRSGISFGAHTNEHMPLSVLEGQELESEILGPKKILDNELNQKTSCLAYPFGCLTDINDDVVNAVKKQGFSSAVTMEQGFVMPKDDKFKLKRIGIGGNDDKGIFELKLSGVIPFFNALKNSFR